MMPFPARVLGAFKIIPLQSSERDLHGPWNKLLNYLFPPESPYTVIPRDAFFVKATKEQSGVEDEEKQPQLWFMKFEVQFESLPILLVLVAAPAVVESPLARTLADAEVREQIVSIVDLCPIPTLRAISAFGPYLGLYTCDATASTPEIHPAMIKKEEAPDVAPRDKWGPDLTTEEGQKKLSELVDNIKAECEAEAETRY